MKIICSILFIATYLQANGQMVNERKLVDTSGSARGGLSVDIHISGSRVAIKHGDIEELSRYCVECPYPMYATLPSTDPENPSRTLFTGKNVYWYDLANNYYLH